MEIAQDKLAFSLEKEKEFSELKSRFVSIVSHQFRTPLTVIQASMGVLSMHMEEMDDTFKPQFEKVYERVNGQISKMTGLMDDVLIIGEINARSIKLELKPIDLVIFCQEIVKNYDDIQTDGRKMIFNVNGKSRKVNLDAKLMEHAISNLISNAFKYSVGKAEPEVNISFKDKGVEISVKDYGVGIPAKDIEYLFRPFYRASNVDEIAGTGLGITIVKEYVELNSGIIKMESKLNQGTEFIIAFNNS